MSDSAESTRNHAVVIGASIAGLCAARVLSDCYDGVTVYERDELPSAPANRATVPQDRHLHMLMARGAIEFDSLFPPPMCKEIADLIPDAKFSVIPGACHLSSLDSPKEFNELLLSFVQGL